MNSFNGQSIAAIPNGTVGDDDMPVLNVKVYGTNTLSGSEIEGTGNNYGCLFIELGRSNGEDSEINISGTGTLNLGKYDSSVGTPRDAFHYGIACLGDVNISGGATVNINYTVGGLDPTTTPKKTITGIYADNVTVTDSILRINLDGISMYPSVYSNVKTPTTAPIYGIHGNLIQSGNGYTSIDTTATNAQSTDINSVTGDVTINSANAAVYLKNKKGNGMAVVGGKVKNNYSSNVGTYDAAGKDFEYKACVTYNRSNTNVKSVLASDIYKLMTFGREGEEFRSDAYATDSGKNFYKQYYMHRVDEDGQWWTNEDCYKTSNQGDYLYEGYMRVAPQPGYMVDTTVMTMNPATYYISMRQVMEFAPSYTYMQGKMGIFSAIYLYPDIKITSQPKTYYCKDVADSLKVGISDVTKVALNYPDDYSVDIKYEWHLKAAENGTTEDVLVKDVGFATGYDTNTLTIDKTKYAASKVKINGSDVSLADIDNMSIYCAVKSIAGTVRTKEIAFNPFGHIDGEKKIDKKAGFGIEGEENTYCASCDAVTSSTPIPAIDEKSVKLKSTTYTYTGKQIKPTVYSKDVNGADIEAGCRAVTYSNNTKVGKATATITFNTIYDAAKTMTFKILPKKASIKSATVGKKKVTVKMGTKVSSTGGTKYQIKYRVKGTSTWKTKTTTSQTYTIKSLKKGKKYQIKVRAYKDSYYGEYSAIKTTKAVK